MADWFTRLIHLLENQFETEHATWQGIGVGGRLSCWNIWFLVFINKHLNCKSLPPLESQETLLHSSKLHWYIIHSCFMQNASLYHNQQNEFIKVFYYKTCKFSFEVLTTGSIFNVVLITKITCLLYTSLIWLLHFLFSEKIFLYEYL